MILQCEVSWKPIRMLLYPFQWQVSSQAKLRDLICFASTVGGSFLTTESAISVRLSPSSGPPVTSVVQFVQRSRALIFP